MGTQKTSGFTIVESMLFLAISGVLVVTMIGGVGVTIQIQRYRDAVETFKSLIQDQYSELTSVKNEERAANWTCNAQAETVEGGNDARSRGQGRCVILGRYMTIQGADISLRSVVGFKNGTSTTGNDIDKLISNYVLNTSTLTEEDTTLEWGAQIAWPREGVTSRSPQMPRDLSILFIRSPDSGQVYTFTNNSVPATTSPTTLDAMLIAEATVPGRGSQTICIDSGGVLLESNSSIYIEQFASGPTAIEIRSNDFHAASTSTVIDRTLRC